MDKASLEADHSPRQSNRFLALYALAAAGGSATYAPFLTLLLPVHVTAIWGDESIRILSYCAFAGAVSASVSSIVFGWLSDRTGNRKRWILAGLILSSLLLVSMRRADTVELLLAMIVVWQVALNMMLNPLLALAGDFVPDNQKGTLGGLLAFSPACGALVGALVTMPGLAGPDVRLVLVAGISAAMVLPVLLVGRPAAMPQLMQAEPDDIAPDGAVAIKAGRAVRRMWLARLLVQIGEAALFAFLLLWMTSLDDTLTDSFTARLFTAVLFTSVPLAFLVGRWSDRTRHPILPLVVLAGGAACGMLVLSTATTPTEGIIGYMIFGVMAGIFLALHSSQTLRVLPRPATRGRDLGLFNLTNTLPSLIMPWLTLALVPVFGFNGLFLALACFCALACLLLATMPKG